MRSCKSTALLLALALIFAYAPVSASAEELPARRLELYWQGDADIETSDVWAWMPGKDGRGYLFESCDYGFVCDFLVINEGHGYHRATLFPGADA